MAYLRDDAGDDNDGDAGEFLKLESRDDEGEERL